MFAQNGEKGLIPGESWIRRFQNIEKVGSDLIQVKIKCMDSALSTAAVQTFPTVSQRGAGAWMTLESINHLSNLKRRTDWNSS